MAGLADRPPPDPERGNAVRKMIAGPLLAAAGVCVFAASALVKHERAAAVCVFAVAGVLLVAFVAVLAGKGRQS